DGTAWMAMYALNMMRIALELALDDHVYEDIATKFFEHFLYIAEAMTNIGGDGIGLWDEGDEFYYDVLHLPGGERIPLRLRSMVGLIPLFAVEVLDASVFARLPAFTARLRWFLDHRPKLSQLVSRWRDPSEGERHLLSLLRGHRMKRLLSRMLDETEFLSDNGVRSLSKFHEKNPYVFEHAGNRISVGYSPGECASNVFGGNSNWRGPVWFPVNFLMIESLQKFNHYFGDDLRVDFPAGSGNKLSLGDVAAELSRRLSHLFLRDRNGRRAVFGGTEKFQNDPQFRDYIPFHEYFHGDNGAGIGASHQTGWTALAAKLLQQSGE
ncbi:MAG: MGH1-like glycoside hydrolase domain-containing protein, partial [Pseudomonadota bacterium]